MPVTWNSGDTHSLRGIYTNNYHIETIKFYRYRYLRAASIHVRNKSPQSNSNFNLRSVVDILEAANNFWLVIVKNTLPDLEFFMTSSPSARSLS